MVAIYPSRNSSGSEPLEGNVWDAVKRTLEHPEVVITEVRRRQADLMPYAEDSLKRVNRELGALAQEECRMLKLFRVGDINEEYVEEEIKDIRRKQSALKIEKREIDANRRVLESLENAESQLAQVCALVENNLKSLDYCGKREALDAIGAKVMVGPDHTVLLGHIPRTFQGSLPGLSPGAYSVLGKMTLVSAVPTTLKTP